MSRPHPRDPGTSTAPVRRRARLQHWESVYRENADAELGWTQARPEPSLSLVRRFAAPTDRVLDVGGGSSSLARRLVDEGYDAVTVLDVSATALERGRAAAGASADRIRWRVGDITDQAGVGAFELWHDRALFHFLTQADERRRYVALARRAVRPRGHLILAAFAPDGPERCSGLPVLRYDAGALARELGSAFRLVDERRVTHRTPGGVDQRFVFAVFERVRLTPVARPARRRDAPRSSRSRGAPRAPLPRRRRTDRREPTPRVTAALGETPRARPATRRRPKRP